MRLNDFTETSKKKVNQDVFVKVKEQVKEQIKVEFEGTGHTPPLDPAMRVPGGVPRGAKGWGVIRGTCRGWLLEWCQRGVPGV